MTTPTIAVKESLDDLKGIGPSTGISGFKLVYVIGKGLYQYQTGDQSSNVPSGNDADNWVAPSEDTSGKSGAWQLDDSGILDPEHATDSGTDAFVSATNTSVPGDGVTVTRDFQSANTTATPTLDGKTMTTRDGSALWAGAVSGPHDVQYASGTDTYLVLEPLPIDEDDMSSDSAAAVPTQQSVKAYTDAGDPTLDTLVDATNGGNNDLTEVDFTGIKSGANRIDVLFNQVSLSGTDNYLVQIGDSGGVESSGYEADGGSFFETDSVAMATSSSGFPMQVANAAGVLNGVMTLHRVDSNIWVAFYTGRRGSSIVTTGGGRKSLSAELDRIRITVTGSNTFDGGSVNIKVQ